MRLVLMIFFQVHIKLFLYKHCQGHLYQLDYLKTEIDRYRHDYGIKRWSKNACSMEYNAYFI